MSQGRRASFVVRVVQDRRGRVRGVVELVATGAKEAFAGAEAIGRVIRRLLPRAAAKGAASAPRKLLLLVVMDVGGFF